MSTNFEEVTAAARSLRTAAAVLELIDAYATNGCATYPADTELIREVFSGSAPEGYKFTDYAGMVAGAADLVITRVAPTPAPAPAQRPRQSFNRGDKVMATVRAVPEPAIFLRYDEEGFLVVKTSGGRHSFMPEIISIDPNLVVSASPVCLYPCCGNTARSRGLCHLHYQTMRAYVRAGKVTEASLEARGFIAAKGTGNSKINGCDLFLNPAARGRGVK